MERERGGSEGRKDRSAPEPVVRKRVKGKGEEEERKRGKKERGYPFGRPEQLITPSVNNSQICNGE